MLFTQTGVDDAPAARCVTPAPPAILRPFRPSSTSARWSTPRRAGAQAGAVVVLGDGAPWIWNLVGLSGGFVGVRPRL